jgi:branched-chain amino acid transport system ATP-binding protein
LLEINKINVFYGSVHILRDVSLKIERGEIVALVGSNAAGKTTLLRTISGLIHPRSGRILFKNESIENLPPYEIIKRGIAHIPEGRRIFPFMTVKENIEMGNFIKRSRREEEKDILNWIFELFPILKERLNQRAGTLSGGEQQMLAIARALMSSPELLLIDEPSSGLAPIMIQRIIKTIGEEMRKRGITILLVEQNVHLALRIADRGYVIENGKIVLEGRAQELLNNEHIKKAYLGI